MHQEEKISDVIVTVTEGKMKVVADIYDNFIWDPSAKRSAGYNWQEFLYTILFCYNLRIYSAVHTGRSPFYSSQRPMEV